MDATEDLGPALAPVKEHVDVPRHGAEIVQERQSRRVEGGEEQAFVAVKLGHGNEAPLGLVKLVLESVLQVGHRRQLVVGAEGPAVVGTYEGGGVAVIGAPEAVAAVAADVQEGVDLSLPVRVTSTGSSPM